MLIKYMKNGQVQVINFKNLISLDIRRNIKKESIENISILKRNSS